MKTVSSYGMNIGGWKMFVYAHKGSAAVLLPEQVHGSRIVRAEELQAEHIEADGVIVSRARDGSSVASCGIQTADCMPLAVLTEEKALMLHVSRKTLIAGLLDNMANCISFSDIKHVWIGPHICEQHFTFEWEGSEIKQFREHFPQAVFGHPARLSLRKAVQKYFDEWGVMPAQIHKDERCTYEDASLPSYKRWLEKEKQGPLGRIIATAEPAVR